MNETTSGSGTIGCPFCGTYTHHSPQACPMVESIEFFENGTIKKIVKRNPFASHFGNPSPILWPTLDGKLP